jgi:DNA-binding protein Fis
LEQKKIIEELAQQLQKLSGRVDSIIDDNKLSTKAILEKATILVHNPEYPKDMFGQPLEASNDDYRRAVTLMQASVRTIEKLFDFLENPFNYLLEVATRPNSVASNCGLSKMQQAALIMSFIPATSPIYRDLAMLDTLEELFHYSNLCSTTTMTRTEILAKIDAWTLDTKNYATLNESLAALRTYYADLSGKGNKVNKVELYQKVLQRVKKERGIPSFVHRMLDESNLKIERETNTGEMLELVLAPLKYLLNQKKPTLPVTHQVELDNLDPLGAPLDPANPTFISDSGLKNDGKQQHNCPKSDGGSKKKKGNSNGNVKNTSPD